MSPYRVRRATTDDLEQLIALWQAAQLPALELEKRFTEFQVVENTQGKLAAAIAITICGYDAKIHNETFADFGLTDTLRPLLWERLQAVAKNNGLFRLWTNETAPFWKKDAGFTSPGEAGVQKWPEAFGGTPQGWLMLQLRDESASPASLERELTLYKEAEQARLEALLKRARAIKIFATVIAALLLLFVLLAGISIIKHSR